VTRGPVIGHAGVFVADVGRKEFQEPSRGMIAGIGNRSWNRKRAAQARRLRRCRGLDNRRQVAAFSAHDVLRLTWRAGAAARSLTPASATFRGRPRRRAGKHQWARFMLGYISTIAPATIAARTTSACTRGHTQSARDT